MVGKSRNRYRYSKTYAKLVGWHLPYHLLLYRLLYPWIRHENKNVFLIIALVIAIFGFGTFNFYRCYGSTFTTANYVYWNGIEPYVMSVLIFLIISKLKLENINVKAKFALWKISDLVLGTYLVSFILIQFIITKFLI